MPDIASTQMAKLLHEAVSAHYASMTGEKPIDSTPPPPKEPPVFYDI